jgi:hypothetical protein
MTMTADDLGFAEPFDQPINYLRRITDYYLALGYDNPYRWAHYVDAPFTAMKKPVKQSRIALVTTAAPYQTDKGEQGPGAAYNAGAKFYRVYAEDSSGNPDLRISHLGYDRAHTTAADINSYFPLQAMQRAASKGEIGALAPRFYGAPTNRSQVTTIQQDCAEILRFAREDSADAAVIVAN